MKWHKFCILIALIFYARTPVLIEAKRDKRINTISIYFDYAVISPVMVLNRHELT